MRELRDNLTVIDFYLKKKRQEIEARLLDSAYEYEHQREILNGDLGYSISSDGAGLDYTIPPGETDGELFKIVVRRTKQFFTVGCCSVNDRCIFNLCIKFDYPPDPFIAMKHISRTCLELNSLHFETHDPLNYMAYVKLPLMTEADLDNALMLIRHIPKLTSGVRSEGIDVHVEDL